VASKETVGVIGKPKPNGMREVFVYDPLIKRKRYVGQRATLKAASLLEAKKIVEFAGTRDKGWTIDLFAAKFLSEYHGPNTSRPEPTTKAINAQNLRRFREEHGSRLLASFTRDEAHALAVERPHEAKSIAAMFAVAVDKEFVQVNPFARLGIPRSTGRDDIDPLTEAEVEQLAQIALKTTGHWGPEFWALILWMAWTGMRPGEVCALDVSAHVDWKMLEVRVEENMRNDGTIGPVKGKQRREIVIADQAEAAAATLRRRSGHLFLSPTGKPLRPNSLRHYWVPVRASFTAQLPDSHWLRRRLMSNPGDQLDPYELRHFCGSMLADRGQSARDIAAHLGNSERICEKTYIHDHKDRQKARLREAFNRPNEAAARPDGQVRGQEAS
jgi:integrase